MNNSPTSPQDLANGDIGTSFFSSEPNNELFILGDAMADTDEFDWHVMIHEFGHWMQFNRFRDDNPGGSHGDTEIKDPRLTMSEGFGNAFGALSLEDGVYKDTTPFGGSCDSIEYNLRDSDTIPGWFSEATVETIIFDLFDSAGGTEASGYDDQLALTKTQFVAALDFQKSSRSLTTVFSFLAGLNGVQDSEVDSLLAFMSVDADFGINSKDEFGVGETHDAGVSTALPVYTDATVDGGPINFTVPGQVTAEDQNWLQGNRFVKFIPGSSGTVEVAYNNSENGGNVAIELYENGIRVDESFPDPDQDAFVQQNVTAGSTYVVVLSNQSTTSATNSLVIQSITN